MPSAATGGLNPYQWTLRDAERKLAGLPAPTGGTARAGSTREETKTETAPAPAAKRTIGSLARLKTGPAAEIAPSAATGGLNPYQWTLRDAERKLAGLPAPAGGTAGSGVAWEEPKTETAPAAAPAAKRTIGSLARLKTGPAAEIVPSAATGGLNPYQWTLRDAVRKLAGIPAPAGGTVWSGIAREETKTETAPAAAAQYPDVIRSDDKGLNGYQQWLMEEDRRLNGAAEVDAAVRLPGGGNPGWGADAAYLELLREQGRRNPALYSNPNFIARLSEAERRVRGPEGAQRPTGGGAASPADVAGPAAQYPDVIRSDDKGLNGYQRWLMEEDRRLNRAGGDAAVRLPGSGNPGWGADAAYLELLREQGRRNRALYSNPNFIARLSEAERRVREKEGTGPTPADSYDPDRNRRVFNGTLLKTAQDAVNLMGTLAKESAAASYNSAAMDQKAFGNLFGWENADENADALLKLSAETSERALEPIVDFGSRYQAETAEMYPHTGPGREFFDQVISAGAGMLPSVVGNLLVPGSGLYISMMLSMSSAFAEAVERGADEASALAYCVSVGIAGTLVEKLTDGLGGLFGRSGLSELLNDALSEALGNPAAREGFIFLAGMAGEGFEEFLSVFAEELMRVNLLGTEARSREELLGDAKRSFFVSALVSGLVQGAAKLGSLGVDADPAELGRLYADETAAGFYGADVELYGPTDVELYEPTDVELYGPETDVYEYEGAAISGTDTDVRSTDTGLRDAYTEPLGTNTEAGKLDKRTPTEYTEEVIDIGLKRGRGWDEQQNAAADEKLRYLTEGITIKTIVENRKHNVREFFRRAAGLVSIDSNMDVDHKIDLQLGGTNELSNLWLLDKHINRSLGKQVELQIRKYPVGTKFGKFYFKDD